MQQNGSTYSPSTGWGPCWNTSTREDRRRDHHRHERAREPAHAQGEHERGVEQVELLLDRGSDHAVSRGTRSSPHDAIAKLVT